jgi:hypothetical protein
MRAIVWLLLLACSSQNSGRENRATELEAVFRAKNYVVDIVARDRTLAIHGFQRRGRTKCFPSTIPMMLVLHGRPEAEEDYLPRIDQKQLVADGFTRIECEDGGGGVFGVDLPYDVSKPIH